MKPEPSDSGLEELLKLQKKISQTGENITKVEAARAKREKELATRTSDIMQGLTQIKISVALQQLEPIAPPEIIEKVNALSKKRGTRDLRNLVQDLSNEIEGSLHRQVEASPELAGLETSMKTLNVLLELLFALEYSAS